MEELRAAQGEFRAEPRSGSIRREEISGEVEEALRKVTRTPQFVTEVKRTVTLSSPRPKGVSVRICDAVAAFCAQIGRPDISSRYVRRCWDNTRRFDKNTFDCGME